MKKVVFGGALALGLALTSCGPDVDAMVEEYCACMEKDGLEEMSSCLKDFQEKYKDVKGSDDKAKEFEEKIKDCGKDKE